jgi:hypothetical protein
VIAAVFFGAAAAAAAPVSVEVNCTLNPEDGALAGTARITLVNVATEPLEQVYVWLYPNRFARKPRGLDDVNFYWYYPRRFSPGRMTIVDDRGRWRPQPHAAAGRDVLWAYELERPVPPGGTVELTIAYRGRVPERYGSFGCVGGTCTLVGGFYPMPAALGARGWDLRAPPQTADVRIRARLTNGAMLALSGRLGQRSAAGAAEVSRVPFASLFAADRYYQVAGRAHGVDIRLVSRDEPPPVDATRDQILPYSLEPYGQYTVDVAKRALDLLGAAGFEVGRLRELPIVQAPLRTRLAAGYPGLVLVSDRWFRIWPAQRLRKFHARQLAHAVFRAYFLQELAEPGTRWDDQGDTDPAALIHWTDVELTADLLAAYFTDLFTTREYERRETAADILQPVRFLPAIDQILYAPQLMFSDAYFGTFVTDSDDARDDPLRFSDDRAPGALYYEKLRDLLSADQLAAVARSVVREAVSVRAAAEQQYGADLSWFFRQWALPGPRVNYRLGKLHSRRSGDHYENQLEIVKDVAAGDPVPVEPVEVVAEDQNGQRYRVRWDGQGQRGLVQFTSAAPIEVVALDPRRRLSEARISGDDNHALYDNRRPRRVRFVFNSLGLLLNVTDLSAILAADFSLARVHDLRHRSRFAVFTSSQALVGASAAYNRFFGPPITPDALLSTAQVQLTAARLRSEAFAAGEPAATQTTLGLGLGSSNRVFAFEPRESASASAELSLSLTRVDGTAEPARLLVAGTAAADYSYVTTLAGSHTLAARAGAAAVAGDIEQRSQLIAGGGITGVRGYGPTELFGRVSLRVQAEYRHVFVHDLDWNIGHYQFVRGFGGALSVDAVALTPENAYALSGDDLFASVGYGLRIFYDSFGTLQQLTRLDVAVRIDHQLTACLSRGELGRCPAPAIYLSFLPPF